MTLDVWVKRRSLEVSSQLESVDYYSRVLDPGVNQGRISACAERFGAEPHR